jgi:hypothetical protein
VRKWKLEDRNWKMETGKWKLEYKDTQMTNALSLGERVSRCRRFHQPERDGRGVSSADSRTGEVSECEADNHEQFKWQMAKVKWQMV